jgi:hypothetical protein
LPTDEIHPLLLLLYHVKNKNQTQNASYTSVFLKSCFTNKLNSTAADYLKNK